MPKAKHRKAKRKSSATPPLTLSERRRMQANDARDACISSLQVAARASKSQSIQALGVNVLIRADEERANRLYRYWVARQSELIRFHPKVHVHSMSDHFFDKLHQYNEEKETRTVRIAGQGFDASQQYAALDNARRKRERKNQKRIAKSNVIQAGVSTVQETSLYLERVAKQPQGRNQRGT